MTKDVYRKFSLNASQVEELHKRIGAGEKKAVIARDFGICRKTLYQYVRLI